MPKKKRLLILLGAGSSRLLDTSGFPQGMPSVADLDREMQAWAGDPDLVPGFPGNPNYYELARKNREDYFQGASSVMADIARLDYERVLGDLNAFLNGFLTKPMGDPVLHWLQENALRGLLDFTNNNAFYGVQRQIAALYARLAGYMRQKCVGFEVGAAHLAPFASYTAFLRGLGDHFDLGVYTLNYDTLALTALPGSFTGFDTTTNPGPFDPGTVHQCLDWHFIYHLHGSVHHSAEGMGHRPPNERTLGRILWQTDLTQCSDDRGQLLTATDHRRMVPTTLVAGGWKLDQIQEDPFLTFYSALPRHAYEADAVLIGGYGFGDDHINNVLRTMLRSRNSRPPVLVLGRSSTPTNLVRTLIGPNISPAWRDAGLGNPQFEAPTGLPNPTPVLVWRGGFENAGAELSRIIPWLDSGRI